jgi:hypothetical protein
MSKLKRYIKKAIADPNAVPRKIRMKLLINLGKKLSDDVYLKRQFKLALGKTLNLDNTKTFNEKIQWLKLYDRKPEYTCMADKIEVRNYINGLFALPHDMNIGTKEREELAQLRVQLHFIPLLGIWDSFDEIDFDRLPEQFVLKCNHDSGSVIICKNKKLFDFKTAQEKIEEALKRNYYWFSREYPYKNIKPKILAEALMIDESGTELKDYKFLAFEGEVSFIWVDYNRFTRHKRNFYNTNWDIQDFSLQYPHDKNHIIDKPKKLDVMLKMATVLSAGIPHIRVDFYCINDKIYFGELTFYPEAGYGKFTPEEWDYKLGSLITLPPKIQ